MPIKIDKRYFVGLREAFDIVGQESFGAHWVGRSIEEPESDQHETARQNLWAAFQSAKVPIFINDGDISPRRLTPRDVVGLYRTFDLKKDVYIIHPADGHGYICEIDADELRAFVRSHADPPLTLGKINSDENACANWLNSRGNEYIVARRKKRLLSEAKREFRVSDRAFERIWKTFTRDNPQYKAAGRPRKIVSPK